MSTGLLLDGTAFITGAGSGMGFEVGVLEGGCADNGAGAGAEVDIGAGFGVEVVGAPF